MKRTGLRIITPPAGSRAKWRAAWDCRSCATPSGPGTTAILLPSPALRGGDFRGPRQRRRPRQTPYDALHRKCRLTSARPSSLNTSSGISRDPTKHSWFEVRAYLGRGGCSGGLRTKSAVLHHGVDGRRLAAPGLVNAREILRIAERQNHAPKAFSIRGAQGTVILEPLVRVVIEHLRPQVGIVAGRITAAPDMAEVAGSISRRHGMDIEVRLDERLPFEFVRALQGSIRRQHMPLHVELGRGEHFGQSITGVEVLRLLEFFHQGGRQRRARLVVPCIVIENGRINRPVFVELRGKLDEIAR